MYKRKALDSFRNGLHEEALKLVGIARDSYVRASEIDPLDAYSMVNVGALTLITGPSGTDNPAYANVVRTVTEKGVKTASTWDLLALGEAHLALGQNEEALDTFSVAQQRVDFKGVMRESAVDQLALLKEFGLTSQA